MASKQDGGSDSDEDFFRSVYGKEYRGPAPGRDEVIEEATSSKTVENLSTAELEDDYPKDLSQLPTDFTTREARLWDAKVKAAEKYWNQHREEELTCELCGERGHFSQGCPSTLGKKEPQPSKEHQRVLSFKDRRLKARIIGPSGSVVKHISRTIGCKIRLNDSADGSFKVNITAASEKKVKRAAKAVSAIVETAEEEWQAQALPPSHTRPERGELHEAGITSPASAWTGEAHAAAVQYYTQGSSEPSEQHYGGRPEDAPSFPLEAEYPVDFRDSHVETESSRLSYAPRYSPSENPDSWQEQVYLPTEYDDVDPRLRGSHSQRHRHAEVDGREDRHRAVREEHERARAPYHRQRPRGGLRPEPGGTWRPRQ